MKSPSGCKQTRRIDIDRHVCCNGCAMRLMMIPKTTDKVMIPDSSRTWQVAENAIPFFRNLVNSHQISCHVLCVHFEYSPEKRQRKHALKFRVEGFSSSASVVCLSTFACKPRTTDGALPLRQRIRAIIWRGARGGILGQHLRHCARGTEPEAVTGKGASIQLPIHRPK